MERPLLRWSSSLLRRRAGPLALAAALALALLACVEAVPTPTGSGPAAAAPVATIRPSPTPTALPSIPEPRDLRQRSLDLLYLAPGGWSARGAVLSFRGLADGSPLAPEVELAGPGEPFRGVPSVRGLPVHPVGGAVEAQIRLSDLAPKGYRWQARFVDAESGRAGAWQRYSLGDLAFRIAGRPPSIEGLTFADAARSADGTALVGESGRLALRWSLSAEETAALDRLVFRREPAETGTEGSAPTEARVLSPDARSLEVTDLLDGDWRLRLWAEDKAGQVGEAVTVRARVRRQPPQVAGMVYRTFATNPHYRSAPIRFTLSQTASVRLLILAEGSSDPLRIYDLGKREAAQEVAAEWDGRDSQGQVVRPGRYWFRLELADEDFGNRSRAEYKGLEITDKAIHVSLSGQSLTASDGSGAVLTTLVTTGGQELPTKAGNFEVEYKSSPFTFQSPFPPGSRYWYPPATVRYALLFDPREGNFLHDKSSRTVFGPGTNGPGIPGGQYSGSHGCVNVPGPAIARLYEWAPLGTPVIIEP